MSKEITTDQVLYDIAFLYELAQSTLTSLDLQENCRNFLKTLMSRRNFAQGAVWIYDQHLSEGSDTTTAGLVYSHPALPAALETIRLDHPVVRSAVQNGVVVIGGGLFQLAADEDESPGHGSGSLALFQLGDLGLLGLHTHSTRNDLSDREVNQLGSVARRFAMSLGGCISHLQLKDEVARREQSERILQAMIQGTASGTGTEFFEALVEHLAAALEVKTVLVARHEAVGSTNARSLAVWSDGGFDDPWSYDMLGLPCAGVLSGETVTHPTGVRDIFPVEPLVALEAESYLAVPVRGRDGQTIGHLAVIDDKPMLAVESKQAVLAIFAERAAAEIERTDVETALRASEDEYRFLFQYNPSMFFTLDGNGTVIAVNDFGANQLGYSPEELIGQSVLKVFHPTEHEAVSRNLKRSLEPSGEVSRWRHKKVRKDGSILEVEEYARTVSRDGVPHVLVVCQDITDQLRLQAEQERLQRHIEHTQKLESLGIMAGGIAHDFNNLLTGIMGNAELARVQCEPGSSSSTKLDRIILGAQQAAGLCDQLLAYSGNSQIAVERLSLNQLIEETGHLLDTGSGRRVEIRYELASTLPRISADASQLRQVLMNLVTNAAEAIEDTGLVIISTGSRTCGAGFFENAVINADQEAGEYVYVEVADDGCGMDEDTRRRMFDPFFTTKFVGRGLGLAAALGIVRGHKGTITLDTTVGRGTRMSVFLPVAEFGDQANGRQSQGTVLVVDDDLQIRQLARDVLGGGGFDVLTATDGIDALRVFEQAAGDVVAVLLDITMPRMGGEETFRELRLRSGVPILLSSGYAEQEATRRFVGEGVAGFLKKPYSPSELLARVREIATAKTV